MRRTGPDLTGSRKTVYSYASIGLLALSIAYVLWTNYVVFVGGHLPLTSISLGTGSTGAGLTMLFLGDLILVILMWFLIDGVLLRLLEMALGVGRSAPRSSASAQGPEQWQQQPQQQPQQPQWGPQQQWQPQADQHWQQPQQEWQQSQSQPQPQPQQQWQPQAWPSSAPPTSPPAPSPRDGSVQATLVDPRPEAGTWGTQGVNDAEPVHRRWTPPPAR